MDINDLAVVVTSIIATFLGVLPGLILWHSFSMKYISKANLCMSVALWVLSMGLAIGVIVSVIEWTGELLMNLVGIALIIVGLVYVAALLILLVKYNQDADDREHYLRFNNRQTVGS